ncbi:MAG: glucose-6-phosphate dehydrogenase assembly protein OpcA [Chlamydiota bacterium]
MSMQTLVSPENIESTLVTIWEGLAKKNKVRACLFNLVVYTKRDPRSDSFREVVMKVIENYPCRIIFLSHDRESSSSYLKTAVSVVDIKNGSDTACDTIDMGFGGSGAEKVFFVLLPHLVPDLPIHLLWLDPPSKKHALFAQLEPLCDRLIIDSGSCPTFRTFLSGMREYLPEKTSHISDLNWTRTSPWRHLLAAEFRTEREKALLQQAKEIRIVYNGEKNPYIPHPKTETLYLIFWLANRLGWTVKKSSELALHFSPTNVQIEARNAPSLRPGALISLEILSGENRFCFQRKLEASSEIAVRITSKEKCALPRTISIPKETRGASLSAEMVKKQTNQQYLDTMELLIRSW